jgi:signal peptidase I
MFGKYDPAEFLKKKFKLKGWKAEALDWIVGFAEAALLYFVILPVILGTYPPAVVVQTCSMTGTYNVGDVAVMQGTSFDDLKAPEITTSSLNYIIYPNNISQQTQKLVFEGGQELEVQTWGDIVLHDSPITGEQIIHRAIAKVTTPGGRYLITKGDSNNIPDSMRIECAEWVDTEKGRLCTGVREDVSRVCTQADIGWPGCLSVPVPEDRFLGKAIFSIPLVGHVKMLFMHIVTLGHGYPGPLWC